MAKAMTKSKIIEHLAKKSGLTKKAVNELLEEFTQLASYIRMYVERVIGLDYPLHDSSQPRVLIDKNPEIYLVEIQ